MATEAALAERQRDRSNDGKSKNSYRKKQNQFLTGIGLLMEGVRKAEAIVHNPKNAENDCNADKIVEQLQEALRH